MNEKEVPLEEAFEPIVHYNKRGRYIEAFWENTPSKSIVINPNLTLFKDRKKDKVIGAEVPYSNNLIKDNTIEMFWEEEKPNVAEKVDKHLTLYKVNNKDVVGIKISNIEELVK